VDQPLATSFSNPHVSRALNRADAAVVRVTTIQNPSTELSSIDWHINHIDLLDEDLWDSILNLISQNESFPTLVVPRASVLTPQSAVAHTIYGPAFMNLVRVGYSPIHGDE
jgi:hypothetical protein